MLFESQIHDLKMWLPWCRIRREQSALRAIVEQQRRMMKPEDVASQSAQVISQIEKMTVNLKAPIIINSESRKAAQLIIDSDRYQVKFPIYEILKAAKEKAAAEKAGE